MTLHERDGATCDGGTMPPPLQGRSSAGRALVSKTRGRRFDPCRPCLSLLRGRDATRLRSDLAPVAVVTIGSAHRRHDGTVADP